MSTNYNDLPTVYNAKETEEKIVIIDFHAETTSEKLALAHYLDGRVSAIFGTHTHVQTSDERILNGGTGYITDVGMTGPMDSVLGVEPEIVSEKFKTQMPVRFDLKKGECKIIAEDGSIIKAVTDGGLLTVSNDKTVYLTSSFTKIE